MKSNRFAQKTPRFFRILRNIGATLTAIAAAILGTDFPMPEVINTIAEHTAVTGAIVSIVSQAAVLEEPENKQIKA